jgi:hypothetical protein
MTYAKTVLSFPPEIPIAIFSGGVFDEVGKRLLEMIVL